MILSSGRLVTGLDVSERGLNELVEEPDSSVVDVISDSPS